ncbi:hypothetical protein HanPI659440_Chr10g0390011 [Helianthus annuus]|nr:hypothetical protein HanPI659440_Chr10g0390011 [Helianthus annuus]
MATKTLVSPTGTGPSRWATAMALRFHKDLADEQMDFRQRIAIGTYASYLSSITVFPSNVSRVLPKKVAMAPHCGEWT